MSSAEANDIADAKVINKDSIIVLISIMFFRPHHRHDASGQTTVLTKTMSFFCKDNKLFNVIGRLPIGKGICVRMDGSCPNLIKSRKQATGGIAYPAFF